MKYLVLIAVAISIDAFQALIALALAGMAFATSTLVGIIPFIGLPAAGAVNGAGIAMGVVLDFAISATFGSGLLFLLIHYDMLSVSNFLTMRRLPFVVAKFIPFIDTLPCYTALTVVCILKNASKEKNVTAKRAIEFAVLGAGPINKMSGLSGAMSPEIAKGTSSVRLSSYPSYNQEEEVAGFKEAESTRPRLMDIQPRSPSTLRPLPSRSTNYESKAA